MFLRLIFVLCFCIAFFGCADTERDSINDPGSSNYVANASSDSNSGNSSDSGDGGSSSSCVMDGVSGTLRHGDQDYETIGIGCQVWMAENMNYAVDGSKCVGASGESGTLVDNGGRCNDYGRLYNWDAAMSVCPTDWHLPSDADWYQLFRYVDGNKGSESPYWSLTAGTKLKASTGWDAFFNPPVPAGTDEYGFSALPGGWGHSNGDFGNVGNYGLWWSSSEAKVDDLPPGYSSEYDDGYFAYYMNMSSYTESADNGFFDKTNLYSVRCVQN